MSTPPRSASDLIAAAQADGWHEDPLGREIIAALSQRVQLAKKSRQLIWGLAVALVASLILMGFLYSENTRLDEVAASRTKAGSQAEQNAGARVAAAEALAASERSRADDAVRHQEQMIGALAAQNAATVKDLTSELTAAREETARLQRELARAQALAEKPEKP